MRYLVVLLTVAACFHPSPPEGAPCAQGTDCPSPLVCDLGVCVKTPQDGAPADAPDVDAPPDVAIDADPSCSCAGGKLSCAGVETACTLGCEPLSPGARCVEVDPANGVGIAPAQQLTTTIIVGSGTAVFNTDTGEITGVLARAPGMGVIAGIAYEQRMTGMQPLGVWSFHALDVVAAAKIRFTGARSAVFVADGDVAIAGTIDGTGGCYGADPMCAGPGGGLGANTAAATGCGPGGLGVAGTQGGDSGGGGGGGFAKGGAGGGGGADGVGGVAGAMCLAADAEPLVGGSGGGAGSPGAAAPCKGGGGGGALQITAQASITVSGVISMGGAGGEGGLAPQAGSNAGAGCGGGAGGAILLEANAVTLSAGGVLAANGGGGGAGGGNGSAGNDGQPGGTTTMPAQGGQGIAAGAPGGNGGASGSAAKDGLPIGSIGNGGGGGGGAGTIYVRTTSPALADINGVTSPQVMLGALRTQ